MNPLAIGIVVAIGVAIVGGNGIRPKNRVLSDRADALEAMKHVEEWSKWMAGIETAALGALATIMYEQISKPQTHAFSVYFLSFGSLVYLGCALLCTAWVLSGLPSLTIRLKSAGSSAGCEIYEMPLYGWLTRNSKGRGIEIHFGWFLGMQHWFWVAGLISLASLIFVLYGMAPTTAHVTP